MYVESVDFKRQSWESKILGDLLTRLIANGYQGLLAEVHQAAGRFSRPRADRSLPASLGQADGFADVLIPPAQPHTRVIFFLAQPDLLRMVVAGRNQTEVRRGAAPTKVHLGAAGGGAHHRPPPGGVGPRRPPPVPPPAVAPPPLTPP